MTNALRDLWGLATDRDPPRIGAHLGLITSLLFFVFFSVRVLAVSGGSTQTAHALIFPAGAAVNAGVAVIIALIPLLLALLAAPFILMLEGGGPWKTATVGLVAVVLMKAFATPAIYPVILVVFIAALPLRRLRQNRRAGRLPFKRDSDPLPGQEPSDDFDIPDDLRREARRVVGLFSVVLLPAFLLPLLSPTPWFPTERLTVDGQEVVGYVIGAEDSWITVLGHSDRTIVRFRADSLQDRQLCSASGSGLQRTLASHVLGWQTYPRCDSPASE